MEETPMRRIKKPRILTTDNNDDDDDDGGDTRGKILVDRKCRGVDPC
jgi:hypothetical protein